MEQEEEYMKQNWGMNFVDKVFLNLSQESLIPMDSVKSENYFKNYDHWIILSRQTQSGLYGWFMLYIAGLESS